MPQVESYYIGEWRVEPSLNQITRNGVVKRLEPQLMQVLQVLTERPGWVVTKEQLRGTVWADVIITENVITRAISSLRKLFDDDPADPQYIETISKTGYRLIAKVKRSRNRSNETFTIRLARRPVIMVVGIALLIVLGAFAIREVLLPSSTTPAYHPLAIANELSSEYWPAISPDGRFVAYGWKGKSEDNWDIYAKLIGTETLLRLTDNPSTELRAKWSADGNYIYYLRYENGGSTIYKKPITGGQEIRVLSAPEFSYGDFDISPDEKWISFNDRPTKGLPLGIKLISLETGDMQSLTEPEEGFNGDIHPRFSQDGNKLAFIREKNSVSMFLYVADLVSGTVEQVTTVPVSINGFDWSRDGSGLVYGSNQLGLYKLWEVNLETGETTVLKSGDYQMVMPRVASSGRIIYAKMKDNVNVWSYHLEKKIARSWYATNELNLNPSISPDGTKACFTKQKDGLFEIWISEPDGSGAVPITQFIGQYLTAPRWSADSQDIFFQGFVGGQADIFKVNALGGIPENLTQSDEDEHNPFPARDVVYFSSNRGGSWGIWQMDLDGSDKALIAEGQAYGPQLNEDRKELYYTRKEEDGLWVFSLEEEAERLLLTAFHPMYWGAIAIADEGVYYFNAKEKHFEFYDYESGQSRFVYQPQARIPRLGITLHLSPDGEQLLFTQVDTHDSDIMLLEEQVNQ